MRKEKASFASVVAYEVETKKGRFLARGDIRRRNSPRLYHAETSITIIIAGKDEM